MLKHLGIIGIREVDVKCMNGKYIIIYFLMVNIILELHQAQPQSSNAAAQAINGDAKRILNICKHKPNYKTCKGYTFQFEEEYLGGN